MRATTHIVHLSTSLHSDALPPCHQTVDLDWGADSPLTESLNKYSSAAIFPDLQLLSVRFQQVRNCLVINLQVRSSDHEGNVIHGAALNVHEDFLHRSGNNSSLWVDLIILEPFHSESFSGSSLPIR